MLASSRYSVALVTTFLFSLSALASDNVAHWPAWRGVDGSGVVAHGEPPIHWSETKNIKWKTAVPGEGQSTPTVWGNQVFLQTAIPVGQETGKAGSAFGLRGPASKKIRVPYRFVVLSVALDTGEIQWEREVAQVLPHEGHNPTGSLAPYSPVTDGARVWANFGSRGVYCLTMDGEIEWSVGGEPLKMAGGFGEGSSPVLAGNHLIVLSDHEGQSHLTAYGKQTGEVAWRTDRAEKSSWSSPLLVSHNGREELITSASNAIRSYAPETGDLLWQCEGLTDCAAPTPVAFDGKVYCTTGFRGSSTMAIALGRSGDLTGTDAIVWKSRRVGSNVPSPIVYENRLYVIRGYSSDLYSFDVKTGDPIYARQRIEGVDKIYASPVAVNGHLYFPGRNGVTAVLRSSDTFEIVATNKLDAVLDGSPVVIGDEILLRGRSHLYCIAEIED
jgi:outer membrane protein assembly factor BamB